MTPEQLKAREISLSQGQNIDFCFDWDFRLQGNPHDSCTDDVELFYYQPPEVLPPPMVGDIVLCGEKRYIVIGREWTVGVKLTDPVSLSIIIVPAQV